MKEAAKRIYLGSRAWGIALIFSEIETPTMKLPIIYHTWSLKGETEKHLVLLLFKHMIAERSHSGRGFKRWRVWKGPANEPLHPNARLLSADSPILRALSHALWGPNLGRLEQQGMLQILACVETSRSSQIFPGPFLMHSSHHTIKVFNTFSSKLPFERVLLLASTFTYMQTIITFLFFSQTFWGFSRTSACNRLLDLSTWSIHRPIRCSMLEL